MALSKSSLRRVRSCFVAKQKQLSRRAIGKTEVMKMEKKNDLPFKHYCEPLDWETTKWGVQASVAYFVNGKEIFRDLVKLYSAKDRAKFAGECWRRDGSQALDEILESLEWMTANFDLFEKGNNSHKKNNEQTKPPPSKPVELIKNVSLADVH